MIGECRQNLPQCLVERAGFAGVVPDRDHQPPPSGPDRLRQITAVLWLVWVSVAFGIVSGAVSVTTGLADHSLSVLAVGLECWPT